MRKKCLRKVYFIDDFIEYYIIIVILLCNLKNILRFDFIKVVIIYFKNKMFYYLDF